MRQRITMAAVAVILLSATSCVSIEGGHLAAGPSIGFHKIKFGEAANNDHGHNHDAAHLDGHHHNPGADQVPGGVSDGGLAIPIPRNENNGWFTFEYRGGEGTPPSSTSSSSTTTFPNGTGHGEAPRERPPAPTIEPQPQTPGRN